MQASRVWRYKALPFSAGHAHRDQSGVDTVGTAAGSAPDGAVDFGFVSPAQEWFGSDAQEAHEAARVRLACVACRSCCGVCYVSCCCSRQGWHDCAQLRPSHREAPTISSPASTACVRTVPFKDQPLASRHPHSCVVCMRWLVRIPCPCSRRNQSRLNSASISQGTRYTLCTRPTAQYAWNTPAPLTPHPSPKVSYVGPKPN